MHGNVEMLYCATETSVTLYVNKLELKLKLKVKKNRWDQVAKDLSCHMVKRNIGETEHCSTDSQELF